MPRISDGLAGRLFALCLVALGLYVVAQALGMSQGSLRRIGPGFFPLWLGILMTVLGVLAVLEPPERRDPGDRFSWRGLLFVCLALLAFALLIDRLGLIPAVFAMVFLAALGEGELRPVAALATAVVLCAIGDLLFARMLGIPIRPLIWTFGG